MKTFKIITGIILLINPIIISLVFMYSLIFSSHELIGLKNGYFSLVGRLLFKEQMNFAVFLGLTSLAGVILLSSIKEKE
ncbi:hypothetical protein [Tenacibaculum ovolyticum]|uniref:hypothetical protein n=1 Tax=Tenacibaculum ovolyticum TaxID=104270 RepID=UPI003BA9CCA0